VRYEYEIDGQLHVGNRIRVTDGSSSNVGVAEAKAAEYPAGRVVTVHYDPDNPDAAVLEPGVDRNSVTLAVVGVVFVGVALFIAAPVRRALRGDKVASRVSGMTSFGAVPDGLPADSGVRIVDRSSERIVLFLPAGRIGVASTGAIAGIMLALGTFFAVFFLPDMLHRAARWQAMHYILLSGFGLAWIGGLLMLLWWMKLKYQRVNLEVMRQSARVRTSLLGLGRDRSVTLGPNARAVLVPSHEDNGVPVNAVTFESAEPEVSFAVSLSDPEKAWVVTTINRFLGLSEA
jgi:hypothetical protein